MLPVLSMVTRVPSEQEAHEKVGTMMQLFRVRCRPYHLVLHAYQLADPCSNARVIDWFFSAWEQKT